MNDQTLDNGDAAAQDTPSNTASFEKFIKDVRELGKDGAKGKDALPKLAFKVIDAITQGVLTYNATPKGTEDEADQVYAEYAKFEAKTAIHDRKFSSVNAQVSKLRQIMVAASKGTCDFKGVAVRTAELQKEMFEAKAKVKSMYPSIVSVARVQQTQADSLNDDQIREAIAVGAEEPTLQKKLERVQKILDEVISGKDGILDQDEKLTDAYAGVTNRLKEILTLADRSAFEAMALELGYGPAA